MDQKNFDILNEKIKVWLLILSFITLIFFVAGALRENVFNEWRAARTEYLSILNDKATDELGQKVANEFSMDIQQNVVPALDATDRCITCHAGIEDPRMTDVPQPFKVHSGDIIQNHPPDQFGCTICHSGQGRALTYKDAKGHDVFWEYPILPLEDVQSSCIICHTNLPYADEELTESGQALFTSKGCVDCHALNGTGTDVNGDLSTYGINLIGKNWWEFHPDYGTNEDRTRPPFGILTSDELQTLQDFLRAQHGAEDLSRGEYLYTQLGCGSCHKINGYGGIFGPDISEEGVKLHQRFTYDGIEGEHTVPNWLYEHFIDPQKIVDGSMMPNYNLSEKDAADLTTYMLSLRGKPEMPIEYMPLDSRVLDPQDEDISGRALFLRYCSYCHGINGEGNPSTKFGHVGPGILNTDYLRVTNEDFIRDIVLEGRPERDMPAWSENLEPSGIESILAYIEENRPDPDETGRLPVGTNPDLGEQTFQAKCSTCHGTNGAGALGPKLNDPIFLSVADNDFIYDTIIHGRQNTPMPGWSDLSRAELSGILAMFDRWRDENGVSVRELPDIAPGDPDKGLPVFSSQCASCHGDVGQGGSAVSLHNKSFLEIASDDYLAASIERCVDGSGGSVLSRLSSEEISNVVALLKSWTYEPMPTDITDFRPVTGDPVLGEQIFENQCLICHGENARGAIFPALSNPELLAQVSDGYLAATIAVGRGGTAMLPIHMIQPAPEDPEQNQENLRNVVAYIRSLEGRDDLGRIATTLPSPESEPVTNEVIPVLQREGHTFWLPEQASSVSGEVDKVFYFIVWTSVFFFLLILGLMVGFTIKYRKPRGGQPLPSPHENVALELLWSLVPLAIMMAVFFWGTGIYEKMVDYPVMNPDKDQSNVEDISVLAWQWQWQFTYPSGKKSDELHLPPGKQIQLTMTAQDVLHSLWIPAFRNKQDLLPGRYTYMTFESTLPGKYPLLCAEFCGQNHSTMTTIVQVHETVEDYVTWINTDESEGKPPAELGEDLFIKNGCINCHAINDDPNAAQIGPKLAGIYMEEVQLSDGSTAIVDDNYIRESLLEPNAKIVAGYGPLMTTFQGLLSDDDIFNLIAYLKSLSGVETETHGESATEEISGEEPAQESPSGEISDETGQIPDQEILDEEIPDAAPEETPVEEEIVEEPVEELAEIDPEQLLKDKTCLTCHAITSDRAPGVLGPSLYGIYNHTVRLTDGSEVIADEAYIRESIITPSARIVEGYTNVMVTPPLTPEEIDIIVEFLKSLGGN